MKNLFTHLLLLSIIIIAFTSNAQPDCNPALITNVEHEGSGNRITWTMPTGGEKIVISNGGDYWNCTGDSEDLGVYHRFTQENLATINGGKLSQVVFTPVFNKVYQTKPGHTYTIQIYKGGIWGAAGERNPGTLVSSKKLDNNDLLFHKENTITLDIPVTIDASQELWIGYYCTNIDTILSVLKDPASIDAGPLKEGFGNVMFYQNQWTTLFEQASSMNYNWVIKGIVQTVEGESVNIYFNGDNIESNITGTTFFHENPTGEEHCYKVEVNCKVGGISSQSDEFCIPGVGVTENEKTARFTVYPNPAKNELRVTSYVLQDGVIEIYDVMGKVQKSRKAEKQNSEGEMIIDIANLAAGIYFVRLIDGQGSYVQKFIKE